MNTVMEALLKDLEQQPAVVVLIGISGSGKSTLASQLAGDQDERILSSDYMRHLLTGDADNQEVSGHVFDILVRMCAARSEFGQTSVVDATHLMEPYRAPYYTARGDLPLYYILVKAPLSVCIDRQDLRARKVPVEVIERQNVQLENTLGAIGEEPFDRIYIYDSQGGALDLIEDRAKG